MPIDAAYVCIDDDALAIERRQAIDEGRRFSTVEDEFESIQERVSEDPLAHQEEARSLLERIQELPYRTEYEYTEPSDLDGIRDERPAGPRQLDLSQNTEDNLYDRFLGAWLGRCSGCLLGKPVEGWYSGRLWDFLRDTDNYPMRDYIKADMPEGVWEEYGWDDEPDYHTSFVDEIDHMARDDDIDYTVTGLALVSQHGINFDSTDVADFWLSNLPAFNTYTAERVAYRNFLGLIDPPRSARYCNPYREGIGAQIRGDFYGYICAGDPELAAELAYRDAQISHVKNGIYGEMWVAAMLAVAPVLQDRIEVVETGLTEIPARSRLAEAVADIVDWYEDGVTYDEAVKRVHERWDEENTYEWLHTISNAQVVTIGLLWGEGDFERSIGRAVQAAFDTDCNGATVGSIVGMIHGSESLPAKWTDPFNDTVETALTGYPLESITELARETLDLHQTHM